MKNIFFYFFFSILILNSISGLIITNYKLNNIIIADFTIIYSYLLMFFIFKKISRNAFKISLTFLMPTIWLISFLTAIFMNSSLKDNFAFLFLISLLLFQFIIFIITFFLPNINIAEKESK